ncbi:hypothetical protein QR685DRAFT_573950 [Neurospora intermedia]|uniref:Uncharacterized protein n=1 Tax=Neurospora intermedia TaxID=5142 RepID=A0ABR3D669_NEUIN
MTREPEGQLRAPKAQRVGSAISIISRWFLSAAKGDSRAIRLVSSVRSVRCVCFGAAAAPLLLPQRVRTGVTPPEEVVERWRFQEKVVGCQRRAVCVPRRAGGLSTAF